MKNLVNFYTDEVKKTEYLGECVKKNRNSAKSGFLYKRLERARRQRDLCENCLILFFLVENSHFMLISNFFSLLFSILWLDTYLSS